MLTREQIEALRPELMRGYHDCTYPESPCIYCDWNEQVDALCDLALRGLDAEWQPIETAPKDGTLILAVDGLGAMRTYYYDARQRNPWTVPGLDAHFSKASEDNGYTGLKQFTIPQPPKEAKP